MGATEFPHTPEQLEKLRQASVFAHHAVHARVHEIICATSGTEDTTEIPTVDEVIDAAERHGVVRELIRFLALDLAVHHVRDNGLDAALSLDSIAAAKLDD